MKNKRGWGKCSACGWTVGSTKDKRAIRHGYIRVGSRKRTVFPEIPLHSTGYACKGSGKPLVWHYDPKESK